eukprot:TRINITY_DN5976_c0_g1_i6.p1 TRINITY_DN5976_c0_g1~~TRINITY_DN5976_c0_g1_i6.p1  ORF type:complete len:205 (-),score=56.88 TRINITY_DN5976_c0_g1_i6:624-1238(-)
MMQQQQQQQQQVATCVAPFPQLPADINDFIFSLLTLHELAVSARVSKAFHAFCMRNERWVSDFFVLHPAPDSPVLPAPSVCHCVAVDGSKLYVYGGDQGDPYGGVIHAIQSEFYCFDFGTRAWNIVATSLPRVTEHSGVWYKGHIYLFGGNGGVGAGFNNNVQCVDVSTGAITVSVPSESSPHPRPRSAHSSVLYNGEMCLRRQ